MRNALMALGLIALSSAQAQSAQSQSAQSPATPLFAPMPYLSPDRVLKFTSPQWVTDPTRRYRALLETSKGNLTLELYPQVAPKTVNSFVFLALNHYYEGVPFHRVIEGFMAQTGDPTGTGTGGPGYGFGLELDRNYKFDKPGVLGMARTNDPISAGSQFFITFVAYPSLNENYTVFGRVLEGQDLLNKITRINPGNPQAGVTPDKIVRVTILEEQRPPSLPASSAEPRNPNPPALPDAPK